MVGSTRRSQMPRNPHRLARSIRHSTGSMTAAACSGGSTRLISGRAISDEPGPKPPLLKPTIDRKSTRLNPVTNAHLVCRLLLEKKKKYKHKKTQAERKP